MGNPKRPLWKGFIPNMQNSQASATHIEESYRTKLLTVPILVLTTAISILILVGLENGWIIHGTLYDKIGKAPATTQVIVQIIAAILGSFHVQSVCQLFNFASRIALTQRPMSLDRLKVWNALSLPKMDLSTPVKARLVIVLFFLATLGPSALWAGALTPTPVTRTTTASIDVPCYSEASYPFWSQNALLGTNKSVVNSQGSFSYQPTQDRFGYLVTDGSTASGVQGRPTQHQKNDNSNYTFIGRSYGVASSVGLTDDAIQVEDRTTAYQYTEVGYYPSVECIYNSTSRFGLQLIQNGSTGPKWNMPFLYLAYGGGPSAPESTDCTAGNLTDCGGWVTASLDGNKTIVAVAWWASAESGLEGCGLPGPQSYVNKTRPPLSKAIMSFAAGSGSQSLDKIQCSISMIPTSFDVYVDVLERTITVTLQSNSSQTASNITDIEPSGFIAASASSVLGVMSEADTTLYASVLGKMLQRNIVNLQLNGSTTDAESTEEIHVTEESTLQGVAESAQVLMDDYLLAIASAQLIIAKDSKTASATVSSKAFSIGDYKYALAVIVLNLLILLTFTIEAFRTRLWRGLPKFDYKDIKNVVIASSLGGCDCASMHSDRVDGLNDYVAGTAEIILRPRKKMMLLSLFENTATF